jgi:hypothetical protein
MRLACHSRNRDELDGPVMESRWGRNLRARQDRPRVPPSLPYNGKWVFPGVKRPGRSDNHIPRSSADVANGLDLYLCLPPVPAVACHGVTLHVHS